MSSARVPAEPARARLVALQAAGVGVQQVARVLHVRSITIWRLRSGRQATLPASLEAAILSTRFPLAPHQIVDGTDTRRLLKTLRREGFTRKDLETRTGVQDLYLNTPGVRVRTAWRVRRFFARIMAGGNDDGPGRVAARGHR